MSAAALFKHCTRKLEGTYGTQEAQALVFLLLENLFSLSRIEILADKKIAAPAPTSPLDSFIERLQKKEPIQYILGRTEFYGNPFVVNPSVLIPRPETEELVHLIHAENKDNNPLSILDIGTGSGCIAVSLKKLFPQATVYALDISAEALITAKNNTALNNVSVIFLEENILSSETVIPQTNIVVSNPPYVLHSEKKLMQTNVLDHEPHLALFAEDENPLIFYKAITEQAKKRLLPNGKLYFEINEQFGLETAELLREAGFTAIQVLKDLNGKDRIVRGERNGGR